MGDVTFVARFVGTLIKGGTQIYVTVTCTPELKAEMHTNWKTIFRESVVNDSENPVIESIQKMVSLGYNMAQIIPEITLEH